MYKVSRAGVSLAFVIAVSCSAAFVLTAALCVVIADGTAVPASAFLTIYQSVSDNIFAASFLTLLINFVFKPSTFTSPTDLSDGNDLDPVVVIPGLKTIRIRTVKSQAANILAETDWYIVRKADANTAIPSAITTFRAAVRTKAAAMETLITNASNTPAIETLYTYVNTADEGDPVVMERPLGVFPVLGS